MTCTSVAPSTDEQIAGTVNAEVLVTLGGDEDLATATAFKAYVARGRGFRRQSVELATTLESADDRTVTVNYGGSTGWLASLDPEEPETWELQVWVTWGDGTSLPYPKPGRLMVLVRPSTA